MQMPGDLLRERRVGIPREHGNRQRPEFIVLLHRPCSNWLSTNRRHKPKAISNQPAIRATESLAGVEGLFGPAGLTPPGPPFGRYPSSANSSSRTISNRRTAPTAIIWLGWKDSNLRMAGSKPAALPLGDTPVESTISELA